MTKRKSLNPLLIVARWMVKYLPNGDIAIALIVPFFFMLLLFIFLQVKQPANFSFNLKFAGIGYTLLASWMIIDNISGKKRHKSALNSKRLSPLKELGFEIENIENYWGYNGTYKNYFFRIYYNWNTILPGKLNFREIGIQLYFMPPKTENNKLDIQKVEWVKQKIQKWLEESEAICSKF